MAHRRMEHLPVETILADLDANVAGGRRAVVAGSEDFFRYGASGGRVDFAALAGLLDRMRRISEGAFLQLDHGNVFSVLQYSDGELAELRRLLGRPGRARTDYLWINMGLESASGRLVKRVAAGKLGGADPADWPEMVREACAKLLRSGFFPVFSVVLGLPGETPDDVAATRSLVEQLTGMGAVVFPIFYEPVLPAGDAEAESAFALDDMRRDHLELYRGCYEVNFRRVPRLVADNQRAGGVSWAKRTLMQALGRVEVRDWRRNFRRLDRRLAGVAGASPAGTESESLHVAKAATSSGDLAGR
jgi:radical SAM superfamily enzyme YgiQ (UPF0313 family)